MMYNIIVFPSILILLLVLTVYSLYCLSSTSYISSECKIYHTVIALVSVVLIMVYIKKYKKYNKDNSEDFCQCSGLQSTKFCGQPKELKRLYAEGILTEYTIPGNEGAPYLNPITPYDRFVKNQYN
jgi:hypothetical protein